ncbi:MFS transporter [Actinomadura scrupuli]|uniref:MFS transporter n=1 Tax=Actinomadura scrupuli TaxID=559629 RepID=UPI003D96CD9B
MQPLGTRRWWVLGALVVIMVTVSLDLTALNVALPTLAADLRAGTGELQWIIDSYTLVSATLLIPAGLLGDRYGRKKLLLVGLAAFLVASVTATLVHSSGGLIAARTLMGLGAAIITPLCLSVLVAVFPRAEQPKALAAWAGASFLGLPLGTIIGGYLLDHFWWGSIFLVNIPVAGIALLAAVLLIPETRAAVAPRTDVIGLLLSTGGLLAVVYGTIEQPERGWGSPLVWGTMAGGLAALAAFVGWTRRSSDPLIDLELFRDRRFLGGALPATILTFAMFGVLFTVPQYLQAVQGQDALGTGIRLLPMIAGLVVTARLGPGLARRHGPRAVIVGGLIVLVAGATTGGFTSVHDGYGPVALWLTIVGLGMGLVLPAAMDSAMGALSAERAGVGSAVLMTVRMTGGAFGAAILGSLLATTYRDRLPASAPAPVRQGVTAGVTLAERLGDPALLGSVRSAFVHGMNATLLASAGLMAITALVVPFLVPGRRDQGAPAAEHAGESTHDHVAA